MTPTKNKFAWLGFIFSFLFSFGAHSAAGILDWDQVPREIRNALSLFSKVENNQLKSSLTGEASGHVDVGVFIETLNEFKLFKDKLEFFVLPGAENWKLESIQAPEIKKIFDPISKGLVDGYSGQLHFKIRLSLKSPQNFSVSPNSKLPLGIGFQACSKTICLFPIKVNLSPPLVAQTGQPEQNKVSVFQKLESLLSENFSMSQTQSSDPWSAFTWTKFLILFFAGLLTAFTPCVYPLYPITLGIFGRWAKGAGPLKGFYLVGSYCAGIILSYAFLGTLAAASGALFGSITQTPVFLLSVGFVILFSAVVFSGLIPFPVFDYLQNLVSKIIPVSSTGGKHQNISSFLMGLLQVRVLGLY